MSELDYPTRLDLARQFVDRLFEDLDATVAAIVADGWPEAMAKEGLELHRHTWQVDDLARAFEAEMCAVGGIEALDVAGRVDRSGRLRAVRPESIVHIWPALPGAGLTPVLFGALLGVPQSIRPSSRASTFARYVVDAWPSKTVPLDLVEPGGDWTFGDVVVVSGSDETVEAVRERLEMAAPRREPTVTGYGHRVSLALVIDHDRLDIPSVARGLATDTVMWHQAGCFSARGVVFCGAAERAEKLAAELGAAIDSAEHRLDARSPDDASLADRAQARGLAEFEGRVWGEGLGWVQQTDEAFIGRWIARHVLSLHRIDNLDELSQAVAVPPDRIQGVALAAPSDLRSQAAAILAELGATRICPPGRLQAPPAGWRHDGRPNVLQWVRVVTDCGA